LHGPGCMTSLFPGPTTRCSIAPRPCFSKKERGSRPIAVIAAFGQHFAKSDIVPRRLHHYLIDAQDSRVQGDYDIHSTQTADDAGLAINRAHEFIAQAEEFLGPEEPPIAHDRPAAKTRRPRARKR